MSMMPDRQASHTSHYNVYKVPCKPFEVPAFSTLVSEFEKDPSNKTLRLGQWLMNKYLSGQKNPQLFYAATIRLSLELIRPYYVDYQWPM